jgi:hypothetical protein
VLGQVTVDDLVSAVTVNHAGIKTNRVTIQTTGGGLVTYADWQTDLSTFTLLKNNYLVILQQGAATITRSLDAMGDTADIPSSQTVCTLTVDYPGIKPNRVSVLTAGGSLVTYQDWKQDQAVFEVLQGTYDVVVQHGAKVKTIEDVDCTGTTALVEDIVCTLTVKFPGIKPNRVTINTTGGGLVTYQDWKQDEAVFVLLKNTYDVVVQHGAMVKTIEDVNCTADTALVDGIVCALTVKFPGIKPNRVTTNTTGGGLVTYQDWKQDEAVFALLKGTYDVVIQHGAKIKTIEDVNCTGDTALVDGIVATLTVEFPGFKPNRVTILTTASGLVTYQDWKQDETVFKLLKNHYLVVIQIGSKQATSPVDCTGDTCKLSGSKLTVIAPNGTSVKVLDQGGTQVAGVSNVGSDNQHTFSGLSIGLYDIVLKQGAAEKTLDDVFVFGDPALDQLCQLTVTAPNGTAAKVRVPSTTGDVTTVSNVGSDNKHVFDVLKGTWDLYLNQGAGEATVPNVDCTGETQSVDQLYQLTVIAPNGTSVEVKSGGGIVTSVSNVGSDDKEVLNVIKGAWTLYLKQGAGDLSVAADCSSGESATSDQLCQLSVTAPSGTAAQVRVAGTSDVVTSVSDVGSDNKHVFNVIKGTWDLYLNQGAGTTTVTVDCTGETQSADQLVKWTVIAPNGTAAQVFTADRSGVVTSVSDVGSDNSHVFNVVPNTYDLYLKQGAGEAWLDDVVVTAEKSDDQLFQLTLVAPNGTAAALQTGGSALTSVSNVGSDNTHVFNVIKGTWDLYLEQGAGKKTVSGVDCATGESASNDQLCQLTVNAPNGTAIEVYVNGTSDLVTSVSNVGSDNKHVFNLVKNLYWVSDLSSTQAVDCQGETGLATFP